MKRDRVSARVQVKAEAQAEAVVEVAAKDRGAAGDEVLVEVDGDVNNFYRIVSNIFERRYFSMPGLDRTGPWGEGPMTGGGFGYCNPSYRGYGTPLGRGYGYGRGLRRGFGFRGGFARCRGYGWYPPTSGWYPPAYGPAYPVSAKDEIERLRAEADYIRETLDAINKRIEELEEEAGK
jgi:hypothetical protein